MALDSCTTKITQYLSDSDALQPQDVVECLSDINPFTGLESTYQQSQYYTEHFHLLVINYYKTYMVHNNINTKHVLYKESNRTCPRGV